MTDITCPACGAEFDLTVAFACEEERRAFARLASVSIPLGTRVLKYIALFTPPKQRLTSARPCWHACCFWRSTTPASWISA